MNDKEIANTLGKREYGKLCEIFKLDSKYAKLFQFFAENQVDLIEEEGSLYHTDSELVKYLKEIAQKIKKCDEMLKYVEKHEIVKASEAIKIPEFSKLSNHLILSGYLAFDREKEAFLLPSPKIKLDSEGFQKALNEALKYGDELCLFGCELQGINAAESEFREADLRQANLNGANLRKIEAQRTDFRGAEINYANLTESKLCNCNFEYASLKGSSLRYADLEQADLGNTDLTDADLTGANLKRANFRNAKLHNTIFDGANLENAFFGKALTKNAKLSNALNKDKALSLIEEKQTE